MSDKKRGKSTAENLIFMTKNKLADTNILIRYLLRDHLGLSPKAKRLIERAESDKYKIWIDEVVVAEVIWVLTTHYHQPKDEIARSLLELLSSRRLINTRKTLIKEALKTFAAQNLSYADCWLLAVSKHKKLKLETFDKDLQKQA